MAVSDGIAVIEGVSISVGVDDAVLVGGFVVFCESPGVSVGTGVSVLVEPCLMAVLVISEYNSWSIKAVDVQPSKPGIIRYPINTRFITGSLRTHRNDTV
jgi:hypothetical protein